MMLIYKCKTNKSLDFFISDRSKSMLLHWPKRFDIINGIARGLLYLHQVSRLRVIHRDLKASGILLSTQKSQILALLEVLQKTKQKQERRKLLEHTTEFWWKRNRGFSHQGHNLNLLGHAWKRFTEGRSIELLDPLVETPALYMKSCDRFM
ncbi:G-type lectin S-receptor-like serine/threonine-protein kinase At4g27290 [Rosa rugosa]|uniref:G-type lectin S-receptor-like serine/threonine-protein kinase At4g27290 n=1 Tax=Rosa rugosa TaxID=74645 RepID=UPI002B41869B|nr:G-type lectin S-receptor-like serine/threonine-protein kinase At4g27290 [Rosa rugosa]